MSQSQDESIALLDITKENASTSCIIDIENNESPPSLDLSATDLKTLDQNGDASSKPSDGGSPSREDGDHQEILPQPAVQTWVDEPINILNTRLLDAIVNHNNVQVGRLLDDGASPNATCRLRNLTACHAAALTNEYALTLLLLPNYNAVKDRRDTFGNTPLHFAAWAGRTQNIVKLLDLKELPNEVDLNTTSCPTQLSPQISSSIIDVPCGHRSNTVVEPSWRDSIEHKCEQFIVAPKIFKTGWTPLHITSFAGHHCSTRLLLEAGANLNARDELGRTPLAIAGEALLTKAVIDIDSYVETLKTLLQFRGRLNTVDRCPYELGSALHIAVPLCSVDAIQLLLTAGAPISQQNHEGITPLHECVLELNIKMLEVLTQNRRPGQSVDVTDAKGNTVLHKAIHISWYQGVRLLLDAGADVTRENNDGFTAIHLAAHTGRLDILNEVLNKVDDVNAVNGANEHVETPLMRAFRSGNPRCVEALIRKRASTEFTCVPKYRELTKEEISEMTTFVRKDSCMGDTEVVEHWKNLKLTTKLHINIILHAVWIITEAAFINIIHFLLKHNKTLENLLDYRCPSLLNMTPVEIAAFERKYDVYNFLLKISVRRAKTISQNFAPMLGLFFNRDFLFNTDYIDMLKETVGIFPGVVHILPKQDVFVLHDAIVFDDIEDRELVSMLIKKGADLSLPDKDGKTAISLLIKCSNSIEYIENLFDDFVNISNGSNLMSDGSEVCFYYEVLAPTTNKLEEGGQMRVLKAFLDTGNYKGQRKLLEHPLVQSFLYKKWQVYSTYFGIIIFLYVAFAAAVSIHIVSVFSYNDLKLALPAFFNPIAWISIIYILLAIIVIQEMSLVHVPIAKWTCANLWNGLTNLPAIEKLIEWVVKCLSFVFSFVTPLVITYETSGDITTDFSKNQTNLGLDMPLQEESEPSDIEWQRYLATLTLMLAWLNTLLLLSKTPRAGYYMEMFWNVSFKILKVLLTFLALILMFSSCFIVQFHSQVPFNGTVPGIVKTLVMMTSEFDYENNFIEKTPSDQSIYITMLHLFFVIFLLLVAIALMNLMTGVAVSDVQDLIHKGNLKRIEKQIEFLYELEVSRRNKSFFRYLGLHKWLKYDNELNETLTLEVLDYELEFNKNIREAIRKQAQKKIEKKESKLEEVLQAISKNEQRIVNIETNLAEILQIVKTLKRKSNEN